MPHGAPPSPGSEPITRIIRATLRSTAVIATATGATVAARGTAAIPGGGPTSGSTESVLRFYAVWWAAQGPAAWRLADDPNLDRSQLRAICVTTFLGGLARLAAVRAGSRPHLLFRSLTVVELAVPPVLLALRSRLPERAR